MVIDRTEAPGHRAHAYFFRMEGEICEMIRREIRSSLEATILYNAFGCNIHRVDMPSGVETRLVRIDGTTAHFETTIRPRGYVSPEPFTISLSVGEDFDGSE